MSEDKKKSDTSPHDTQMPLDLKGSEQHHDLKNQPGEHGDPDHADGADKTDGETVETVKEAVDGKDKKNAMSDALKDAVK
jgi:hypothetical protein